MIREVKPLVLENGDASHVGIKVAAGRTDKGAWYKIDRNADLDIWRPEVPTA